MSLSICIAVMGVAVVALVGAALTLRAVRTGPRHEGPVRRGLDRWKRTRGHLVADLGRPGAALPVLAAGAALTFAIAWPLGRLAHRAESAVDVPVFRFFQERLSPGVWTSVQDVLTQMGNRPQIKLVAVLAAVVLAVVWRRRWWVPVLVVLLAFVVEKYVQSGLAKVVDRGHPPTTMGTYPSGGCARLVSMYGTILYLTLSTWRVPVWVCGLLWTLLAEAAWLEGYARLYRLEHWVTDVAAGWLVGALLLGTFVLTASTLRSSPAPGTEREPVAVTTATAPSGHPETT